MSDQPATPALTIRGLESNYTLYCKALRILITEGRTINQIRRSVCWSRLCILHKCLPNKYRDPEHLYILLTRQVEP
ncbi:DUF3136 domain-containing protein [Vulcanococcus limneticus]|uniref:DUF3136 domain-containing protein n=1 Tax=Vulcanococcus limneticus TaxID=2170428 RepID=UPI00398BFD04